MEEKKIVYNGLLLFGLNMLASVINYVCQILMTRVLSIEAFGTINTIFSFMLIVSVPGTSLTMMVSRFYAISKEMGKETREEFERFRDLEIEDIEGDHLAIEEWRDKLKF